MAIKGYDTEYGTKTPGYGKVVGGVGGKGEESGDFRTKAPPFGVGDLTPTYLNPPPPVKIPPPLVTGPGTPIIPPVTKTPVIPPIVKPPIAPVIPPVVKPPIIPPIAESPVIKPPVIPPVVSPPTTVTPPVKPVSSPGPLAPMWEGGPTDPAKMTPDEIQRYLTAQNEYGSWGSFLLRQTPADRAMYIGANPTQLTKDFLSKYPDTASQEAGAAKAWNADRQSYGVGAKPQLTPLWESGPTDPDKMTPAEIQRYLTLQDERMAANVAAAQPGVRKT